MKKITIIFLFISSLSLINAQSSDIDSVKALKVDRNIVTLSKNTKDKFDSNDVSIANVELVKRWINEGVHEKLKTAISSIDVKKLNSNNSTLSKSTLDTLSALGLKPSYNQYLGVRDFNGDGLIDIVMNIAGEPTINTFTALFKQQTVDGNAKFIEDPNYLMDVEGEHSGSFYENIGDINGDGLLDVVLSTENYHGPDGEQPSFMINKTESLDKLFINTGSGFKRYALDTTTSLNHWNGRGKPEWWNTNGSKVIDWDGDGKLEILSSTFNFERIGQLRQGVDRLFTSFEVDNNNNINREFVFDWDYNNDRIDTRIQFLKKIDNLFYLAVFKRKTWDTINSIFVDDNLNNGQSIITHSDMEVVIIDANKSFGNKDAVRKTMKRNYKGGDYIYEKGFAIGDINKNGKVEFIQQYWNDITSDPFIIIYNNDGEDITADWLGDNYMDKSNGPHGGNGFTLIDLNNDGLLDLLPKDGWYYTAQSTTPPQVEGDYGTFTVFMNNGSKFIDHRLDLSRFGNIDMGGGALYFNHAIDIDNDSRYEIFTIHNGYNNVNTKIFHLDYKNEIKKIDNFSIPEDSMKILALEAGDFWGNAVTFEAKSSNQNVNISLVNDTLTIKPIADWNGSAIITAYASGPTWRDSSVFIATVKAVNDIPKPFFWNTVKSDTINITKYNLTSTYGLDWTESNDVEGDSIIYLLYAGTGLSSKVEVYRTTNTTHLISYNDFLERTFEQVPVASSATVYFTVFAYDGTDSVKISRDDRELYINRYEYLSVEDQGIPDEFALHDNYPNPFNPTTTLRFDLPEVSNINLTIYNMLGQKIRTYDMQSTPAGHHALKWNATNDYGDPVGAGIYLYQLQTKDFVKTRKMVLLK